MGKPRGRRASWTDDELNKLRDIWGTMKDAEVAQAIGKTVSGVRLKATVLKLREAKGKRAGTRSGQVTRPWSKSEEMLLVKNVGHLSIFELMDLLPGRTRSSIESRCRRLGFTPTQGTFTRCGIERETGYDWRQIKRARDAIGQVWKRYGVRKYIVTEDQVQEITDWLRDEKRKWSKRWNLDCCVQCGTSGLTERERHSGDGLCKGDWDRRRYLRNLYVNNIISGRSAVLTEDLWKNLIKLAKTENSNVAARTRQTANRDGSDIGDTNGVKDRDGSGSSRGDSGDRGEPGDLSNQT